jgi:hypothetical protein
MKIFTVLTMAAILSTSIVFPVGTARADSVETVTVTLPNIRSAVRDIKCYSETAGYITIESDSKGQFYYFDTDVISSDDCKKIANAFRLQHVTNIKLAFSFRTSDARIVAYKIIHSQ